MLVQNEIAALQNPPDQVFIKTEGRRINNVKAMQALVYNGPGKIELKRVPFPKTVMETDAVVKIVMTTICGTDLGISRGKVPSIMPGTTFGHEGVGRVTETGEGVRNFHKGDHVIISCTTSDGSCDCC